MKPLRAVAGLTLLFLLTCAGGPLSGQAPPTVTDAVFELDSGTEMTYGIAVPAGYGGSLSSPRPLILALHPGGRAPYYGSSFMQSIIEPALRGWGAVIVAPDVPGTRGWANPGSERAVLALLDDVASRYAINPDLVLVTGFSSGGRGVWYLAARNPSRFAGAIALAARPEEESLDALEAMPLYLIHSPDDEVVPYEPVEETALVLADRGYPVHLLSVPGLSHYMMGAYIDPLREAGSWMMEQLGVEVVGGN